jgi:chromosome segregation ATPase
MDVERADRELIAAREEIATLRAELARRRPMPPPLPRTVDELLAAKRAIDEARKAKRAAVKAAAAEKYADDDEVTLQEKLQQAEKLLAAKSTRVRNLERQLRWYDQQPGIMSFEAYSKIAKCLHPD